MKIGIDARMIKATGIGRYTFNLVENLAKLDQENEYFIMLKKSEFESFKMPGSNFKKVLADFHWYGLVEQIKFPKLLDSLNLDLMHFPHFNVPILYKGKFIVTIHDLTLHRHKTNRASTKSFLTYNLKHLVYKMIIKNAVKKSFKIITPSKFTKEEIANNFKIPKEKIVVTYEGGPSSKLSIIPEDDKILEKFNLKQPFLLYVGNAYPHKNLENLVYSLKFLSGNISLALVGKIDEFSERIKKIVQNLNFKERVVFTDFVVDRQLYYLYKKAALYVFPSFSEGFGLPPLEAMSQGVPVASSNYSCLPEILGDSALYFDPKSPKDIAEKINMILTNERLKKSFMEKGLEQIKKYSWEKMAKETLNVYKEVLIGKN